MMNVITKKVIIDFIQEASRLIDENKEYLTELDAAMGDGDLGLTMSTGFEKAKESIISSPETDLGKLLMQTGMVFARTIPSTMGTLIASAFMKAGKSLSGKEELSLQDLVIFSENFVLGIMERGKAERGGRTIVDSLAPAADALKQSAQEYESIIQGCKAAWEAANEGVEKTKTMLPTFGRAVYFGEKALSRPDQGAIVGALIYQALYLSISK
jgi:phosphoenolpyruvate---glycerone phosphotransferase subunit DhaL